MILLEAFVDDPEGLDSDLDSVAGGLFKPDQVEAYLRDQFPDATYAYLPGVWHDETHTWVFRVTSDAGSWVLYASQEL